MIHDAIVPVTCDSYKCIAEIAIEPPYRYKTYQGGGGHYATDDKTLEELLREEGWIVIEGKHYCCEKCADDVMSEYMKGAQ